MEGGKGSRIQLRRSGSKRKTLRSKEKECRMKRRWGIGGAWGLRIEGKGVAQRNGRIEDEGE